MSESLWGEIPVATVMSTPNAILVKQGEILSKATSGDLVGITDRKTFGSGTFTIDFFVSAPLLNNYRYHLFKVTHDVHLYPLKVVYNMTSRDCADESEYREVVREILSSSGTSQVIQALLAQVRDDGEDIPF